MDRLPESRPAHSPSGRASPRRHCGGRSLALTVTVVAATIACLLAGDPTAAAQTRSGMPLVAVVAPTAASTTWSDEFSGTAGSRPDPRKWGYDIGGSGWGNRELESYTRSASNAHLDGLGHLVIVARPTSSGSCWYGTCHYTSARLLTLGKFSQQYGHLEARIKVPSGAGLWPAFWALDNNVDAPADPAYAETDIMEHVGNEPGASYSSQHGTRGSASMSTCVGYVLPGGAAYSDAFHVFSVDWSSSTVTFSVDGHPTATRSKASYGSAWTFDQPMFLILNLAVGGIWAGTPPPATAFPAQLLVDYVRVSSRPAAVRAAAAPTTAPGGCDRAH